MRIYLVQHGLSFNKEADPNRGLTPEGRQQIVQIAAQADAEGFGVSRIFHSGKLRAQQTAEIFFQRLNAEGLDVVTGFDPTDNVENFVAQCPFINKSMYVGHLPFMERLAAYLITGHSEPAVVKFQNAGIVCLEQNETGNWQLIWTIMPSMS